MNNVQTPGSNLSPQILRRRKMLLAFPLLILPFVTMAFWALGGGSMGSSQKIHPATGLNMHVPDAHLKEDKSETKLSYYEEADEDSFKLGQRKSNDPFLKYQEEKDSSDFHTTHGTAGADYNSLNEENYTDPNEEKVYRKLNELNEQLNATPVRSNSNLYSAEINSPVPKSEPSGLFQEEEKDSAAEDPEIRQLNNMMDKILDIQHPGRVGEGIYEKNINNDAQIFVVNKAANISSVGLIDTIINKDDESNSFFGLEQEGRSEQNAIDAVVDESQVLVDGSIIKLRLLDNISIDGKIIPIANFIYGTVSLNGERLRVEITSIRFNHYLYPVKLNVYDLDGMQGIYVPGAITRDVAKESANSVSQAMELSSLDPSVKAQATKAGMDAVKNLVSKKARLVRVTVKAGYKILLK